MANRTKDPELKRIPFIMTIEKNIKDKIKMQAIAEGKTVSEYVENIIKEKLYAGK